MRIDKIVLLVAPVGLALSSLVFSPAIQGTPNARFPPLVDATGAPSFTSQEDNLTPLQLSLDLFKPIHTKGNGPSTLFGVQAPSSASDSAAAPTDAHTDFEASQELNADDGAPGRTPPPKNSGLTHDGYSVGVVAKDGNGCIFADDVQCETLDFV